MVLLMQETREHMKQGIVEMDTDFCKDFSEVGLKMPHVVMIALSGGALAVDQFLRIDNTALAEVILEEESDGKRNAAYVAAERGQRDVNGAAAKTNGDNKDDDDVRDMLSKLGVNMDDIDTASEDTDVVDDDDTNVDVAEAIGPDGIAPYADDM